MDDKWIRETAARITRDVEEKKAKVNKSAETQRLKRELGPSAWNELKEWLNAACKALNTQMGNEVMSFTDRGAEALVEGKADGMRSAMTVTFNGSTVEYRSATGEPHKRYEIAIDSQGHAVLEEQSLRIHSTIINAGKEILGHATKVQS